VFERVKGFIEDLHDSDYITDLQQDFRSITSELPHLGFDEETVKSVPKLNKYYHNVEGILGVRNKGRKRAGGKFLLKDNKGIAACFGIIFKARLLAFLLTRQSKKEDDNAEGHCERLISSYLCLIGFLFYFPY
jgi:hypothetical protein